jgi:hypothetical protein
LWRFPTGSAKHDTIHGLTPNLSNNVIKYFINSKGETSMGTTFIYHKNHDDNERARMEQDYRAITGRKRPRSRFIKLSDKWNRMVEAIAAAASFSAFRNKAADREKDED